MAINRISFYHLETLLWISRLGTFAAAAEKMNTTQPGISARIGELEDRLGAKLFHRTGRSANLTPVGRELVRDYLPLWEQLQDMLLRTGGFDRVGGVVRLAAGEIAAATCLPVFVFEMKARWPDLSFEIEIELTARMIQGLLDGRIDLAFAAGPVGHPALQALPIGAAELLWVASPCVAEQMADAGSDASFSLWSLPGHSPIFQLARKVLDSLPEGRRSINLCNNVRTMIDIVAMGDGFALAPESMVRPQLQSGALVSVMADRRVEPMSFHVVARAGEGDPTIRKLLQCAGEIDLDVAGRRPVTGAA